MRAPARSVVALLAVLGGVASGYPTTGGHGPAGFRGPAIATGSSAAPAGVKVPVEGPIVANCPATIPALFSTQGSVAGFVNLSQTCATGAATYTVTSISAYVATAAAGDKIKCTVYDAGVTTKTKVASGCDTAAATLPANPAAYVTMPTTGACALAPSTRYTIACTLQGSAPTLGIWQCANCFLWQTFSTFTNPLPATITGWSTSPGALSLYLTATSP